MYRSPRSLAASNPQTLLSRSPRHKLTYCHGWRSLGGGRATRKDTGKVNIEWSKWAGPLLTISVFLITQSRLEGGFQQELKDLKEELKAGFSRLERRSDILEKRIDTLDVKFDGRLSDLSRQLEQLGREVSFLQGYKSANKGN